MDRKIHISMVIAIIIGTMLLIILPKGEGNEKTGKVSKIEQEQKNENRNEEEEYIDDTEYNEEQNDEEEYNENEQETYHFTIWLDENHTVHRDNGYAKNLGWTILYNGEEVLDRNAEGETQYKYFGEESGVYTIYLKAWIDGAYRPVSNVVSYEIKNEQENDSVGKDKNNNNTKNEGLITYKQIQTDEIDHYPYKLWMDEEGYLYRTGDTGSDLEWIVNFNGKQVLGRDATNETKYKYIHQDKGIYQVYLRSVIDGEFQQVSNTVTYKIE